MGEARLRSKATTLHPAMALVEEQMSTTAFTPSISAVMQWSSPTQPGTECMVTPVISGPVVASEVATATLTRRGKVAMASLALPVKTVVFSVSVGGVAEALGPGVGLDARRFGQGLGLCHQGDGL